MFDISKEDGKKNTELDNQTSNINGQYKNIFLALCI